MKRQLVRLGRLSAFFDPHDIWWGLFWNEQYFYWCPIPLVPLRWSRKGRGGEGDVR